MSLTGEIKAWKSGGLLFEEFRYTRGKRPFFEPHSHPEYQIGLAVNAFGKYVFRRESRYAPPLNLSIVHSGELHQPEGIKYVESPCRYLTLYVAPEDVLAVAYEIGWQKSDELPFFKEFVFNNRELLQSFVRLHRISDLPSERLAIDIEQINFLSLLVKNFSQAGSSVVSLAPHKQAIKLAREYLDAHYTEQISLAELARIAGVSKYYLCRKFAATVGVPPHFYQHQLRLNQAKKMLLEKRDIRDIALELGFYDQNHFGKYFKKFAETTPRAYAG